MPSLRQILPFLACCAAIVLVIVFGKEFQIRENSPPQAKSKPEVNHSKTTHSLHESDLNIIELSSEAVRRLALKVHTLETRSMPRSRSYGAEVVLPTGAAVIVSAPLSGTIRNPKAGDFPQVGQPVCQGEALLEFLPILTPERAVLTPSERIRVAESKLAVAQAQIDAEGQHQQARVQVEAAQIALARAQRLFNESVGTKQAVDDAQAQLELAKESLVAAKARKSLVDNISLQEDAGKLEPFPIESPLSGIVRATQVQPGQMVAAGAALFEVMNDQDMWIKVPVYVGDLHELDRKQSARLTPLNGRQSQKDVIAKPVALPPTAMPLSASVDLYYEVANSDHRFRPGQKVAANLPLTAKAEIKAVPWSAIVYDIYGGQWVYEQVGPNQYARRRVEVGWSNGGWAALLHGPDVGCQIVTAGAAELMGTEFGFAK